NVYLGRDYDGSIDVCLKSVAGSAHNTHDPTNAAVRLLLSGKIGAIYTGRMEYGPRALGARSIIATPVDPSITDQLNRRLSRSEFMPFAPYVLAEDAERVFEITPCNRYAARFMTICCEDSGAGELPEWSMSIIPCGRRFFETRTIRSLLRYCAAFAIRPEFRC